MTGAGGGSILGIELEGRLLLKWTEKGTLEAQEIGNTTGDRRAQEVKDLVRWGLGITVEQSQADVMRNRRTLFQQREGVRPD